MEIVGPINLIWILLQTFSLYPEDRLPIWNKLVALAYLAHYFNRAVLSPLFLNPSISPIHLSIILSAMIFNYINSSCLAGWLLGYGMPLSSSNSEAPTESLILIQILRYFGIFLFIGGMWGNIRAETTLFALRIKESDAAPDASSKQNKYDKVYVVPPSTGLFSTVLFPHYIGEWIEWLGFVCIGFSVTPPTPSVDIPISVYYRPIISLLNTCGLWAPFAAIVFCVNTVCTTAARASWGRQWYLARFGEEKVDGRGSVIPSFRRIVYQ